MRVHAALSNHRTDGLCAVVSFSLPLSVCVRLLPAPLDDETREDDSDEEQQH